MTIIRTKTASAIAAAAVACGLAGCATLLEGTSQEILVSTNPAGATCTFEREGQTIATVPVTPGAALVQRRKHDITIKCKKAGFEEAVYINNSGLASGAVAGNVAADLLLTAGLSSIVDSASGADNQYESTVNITMIPTAAIPPPAAAAPVTMQPIDDAAESKPKQKQQN
jgi:hypothetical protein